ncbi:NADH dehydrogenase [Nocardioides dokdonensis FR1436]|uniref:NADH dehydrogenase n=1 Tax=Nocardioides dokdonensis FR1436 TaxID=1300347 RepID=A0A1A9GLP0_9ACTN|nr:FAD-dependent oxidoreductase [Nocardioides dokdonensis]ANH38375.1 NADH dehydrogenase [Nocardioides dokdonensis FR1436]
MPGTQTLLLVGAGHAHLHLLRHADRLRAAGWDVVLLAPRWFDYSGVASAVATGALPVSDGRLDVAALAARSGVRHLESLLGDLDTGARIATSATGEQVTYDVVSIGIGSVTAGGGGPVGEDVVAVKPLARLQTLVDRLPAHAAATVSVIGGGSSGLELAAQLAVRDGVARVRLVDGADRVGAGLPPGARRYVDRLLAARGVEVLTDRQVTRLEATSVTLADGQVFEHDLAVLAAGLDAPPLLERLRLGDARGIPVRATLQHVDHDDVYAVGDCAFFTPGPLPRVGVHGVRQAPVLLAALEARGRGESTAGHVYVPPRHWLSVLDLGDGLGLAVRGRWWWGGRGALRLKRRIDRRWIDGYRGTA